MIAIVDAGIDVASVIAAVEEPRAGAVSLFLGMVRSESDGQPVTLLEYEAYRPMALSELERCVREVEHTAGGSLRLAVVHRVGALRVGEIAVACAASAPHRGEAFAACRALIDAVKRTVPIWKREHGPAGAHWVGWRDARCGDGVMGDAHEHQHGVRDRILP
ncbi:MAG: molybdenum cofactor biosynthesis protein MoaE [Polyangiales bacterium]